VDVLSTSHVTAVLEHVEGSPHSPLGRGSAKATMAPRGLGLGEDDRSYVYRLGPLGPGTRLELDLRTLGQTLEANA
jgi:hypothetical protein